ncbi:hypothetical protein EPA93_28240 [Ktedonosporobacter rubrisoli]|uniref:Protein kinase domain-containing protein n=1 Tax=Ktedonosporobacter rubrisoli TaxID=2509675 RepID=A0A4P6JVH3_KTERU|nr:serine/threonine-protein kinase [Ktedonosporobacter rubrisoli]QBD79657.1 hypothetical protein EPA93_28240 [Ktedonosporobacter rubrisoli]
MPDILPVGQQINNYRILRYLGRGGFASVYLAQHIHLKTYAAIKLLEAKLDEANLKKFRREARIVANLRHPHIISVYDFGIDERSEQPYLIMDYAPNGNLRQRHPKDSIVLPELIHHYISEVAQALDFAHKKGIVHRDIKPENLLVGEQSLILLSDFGIATVMPGSEVHSGVYDTLSWQQQGPPNVAGTAAYMAPEQLRGKPVTASDQYSLGIMVYEWLCGERPFHGAFVSLYAQHIGVRPASPGNLNPAIPPAISHVVLRTLEKEPDLRYPSVLDFVTAFAEAMREPAPRPPIARRRKPEPIEQLPFPAPADPQQGMPLERSSTAIMPEPGLDKQPTLVPVAKLKKQPARVPETPHPGESVPQGGEPAPFKRRLFLVGMGSLFLVGSAGLAYGWLNQRALVAPVTAQHGATAPAHHASPTSTPTARPTATNIPALTTLQVYSGHKDIVDAVAWSPDGNYIVSGSLDRTAQLWNANTGQQLIVYKQHADTVSSVAWAPDATYIASASYDQTVQIWKPTNGINVSIYRDLKQNISSVSWSSLGTRIVTAALIGSQIAIFDPQTGKNVSSYDIHSNYIYAVAWSPDGLRIASASGGGTGATVQVWDVTTNSLVSSYRGHVGGVFTVCWSPDGQFIATGGFDKTVRVWKVATGELVLSYDEHKDAVNSVVWSPKGDYIASAGNDRVVRVWTASGGIIQHVYREHLDSIRSLTWSPDGTRVASASADETVRVWKAI